MIAELEANVKLGKGMTEVNKPAFILVIRNIWCYTTNAG